MYVRTRARVCEREVSGRVPVGISVYVIYLYFTFCVFVEVVGEDEKINYIIDFKLFVGL